MTNLLGGTFARHAQKVRPENEKPTTRHVFALTPQLKSYPQALAMLWITVDNSS
jgi:hypothetical protein